MGTRGVHQAWHASQLAVRTVSILLVGVLGVALISLLMRDPEARASRHIDQTYYPEPVAKPGYALDHEIIGRRDIAAYILSREWPHAEPRPAVILVHGGGIVDSLESSKPQYKGEWLIPYYEDIPYSLAEKGILVVMIDAWWAGERHKPEHDDLVRADPGAALFRGYVETSRDVSQVIDYLTERGDVDPKRLGVAGKSGGGIISLMAACTEDRLDAVVAWKAGADFIETGRLRGQELLLAKTLDRNSGFLDEVRAADPIHQYGRIPPKAVALIGNHDDPLMPRHASAALHAKLEPLYEQEPGRLLLKLFKTPKPTHDLQREAFELGCDWLEKHLGAK